MFIKSMKFCSMGGLNAYVQVHHVGLLVCVLHKGAQLTRQVGTEIQPMNHSSSHTLLKLCQLGRAAFFQHMQWSACGDFSRDLVETSVYL